MLYEDASDPSKSTSALNVDDLFVILRPTKNSLGAVTGYVAYNIRADVIANAFGVAMAATQPSGQPISATAMAASLKNLYADLPLDGFQNNDGVLLNTETSSGSSS